MFLAIVLSDAARYKYNPNCQNSRWILTYRGSGYQTVDVQRECGTQKGTSSRCDNENAIVCNLFGYNCDLCSMRSRIDIVLDGVFIADNPAGTIQCECESGPLPGQGAVSTNDYETFLTLSPSALKQSLSEFYCRDGQQVSNAFVDGLIAFADTDADGNISNTEFDNAINLGTLDLAPGCTVADGLRDEFLDLFAQSNKTAVRCADATNSTPPLCLSVSSAGFPATIGATVGFNMTIQCETPIISNATVLVNISSPKTFGLSLPVVPTFSWTCASVGAPNTTACLEPRGVGNVFTLDYGTCSQGTVLQYLFQAAVPQQQLVPTVNYILQLDALLSGFVAGKLTRKSRFFFAVDQGGALSACSANYEACFPQVVKQCCDPTFACKRHTQSGTCYSNATEVQESYFCVPK